MPAHPASAPQRTAPAASTTAASDTALIAVFAALVAASALAPVIPLGGVGVPITLQTLVITLTGLCLGPTRGFLAVLLYVVLGLIGLPIFSQGRGGLGVLAGGSAGYIVAFAFCALLAGLVVRLLLPRLTGWKLWLSLVVGCLLGSLVTIHLFGVVGIMVNLGLPLQAAIAADAAFFPGDVIKTVIAAGLAVSVHRAFPQLYVRGLLSTRTSCTAPERA